MVRKGLWPLAVRDMLDQGKLAGLKGSEPGLFFGPTKSTSRKREGHIPPPGGRVATSGLRSYERAARGSHTLKDVTRAGNEVPAGKGKASLLRGGLVAVP